MRVVSPKRYWKDLMDAHDPGVLEIVLGSQRQSYSTSIANRGAIHSPIKHSDTFHWLTATLGVTASSCSPPHHLLEEAAGCVGASDGHQGWTSCDVGMYCLDAYCQLVLHRAVSYS